MALQVMNRDHFEAVVREAKQLGLWPRLLDQLRYLAGYGGGDRQCRLGYDWAPLSFGFSMFRRSESGAWVFSFAGGLIFHGDTGIDPLSVSVSSDRSARWEIHT
jgi:hypothetical protein